jgi:2-polyprenyl-3-methyl-5-hydroxy-6-metoxy-1,4-benzoquinol methylase
MKANNKSFHNENSMDKNELTGQMNKLKEEYGDWAYDIPLPFDVWTRGNLKIPHTRLKRIVQIVTDLAGKPLSECRVLDLGSLDGLFSIEFAQQGAETVGVEVREANIKKAIFCKEVLNLNNLKFDQADVRNISVEKYGTFDVIICSGLLYHLTAADAIGLISKMYDLTNKIVIIDTHIALKSKKLFLNGNDKYWGLSYHEHKESHSQKQKSKKLWASWDNTESFWFTRPSLINILKKTGFTSVYECFTPEHINYGNPGLECHDRCTFVAVKGTKQNLISSPAANEIEENWPEKTLSYGVKNFQNQHLKNLYRKIIKKIKI